MRSHFGDSMKKGIEMALEDVNGSGSMKAKMVCCFEDDCGEPDKAREAARRLVRDRKVKALVGSYSNLCTLAVAEVAEKMKTPFISPSSASDTISTSGYRWVFRMNAPAPHYALTILDFLTNVLQVHKIALLYENDDFGVKTGELIKGYAKEMKCTVTADAMYDPATPDFSPVLKTFRDKKPQVLLMISHIEDAVKLVKTARRLKVGQALAGCGAGFATSKFISLGGKDVEQVFTLTQWNADVNWPGAVDFTSKFKARFGHMPEYHSAETYATIQVLASALFQKPGMSRDDLRHRLKNIDVDTVFGAIRFENYQNYTNQNSHPLLVQQVQNGRFVLVWPQEYKKGDIVLTRQSAR
jgi:branched-chain amino acid transport system substrate-binding protein